MNQTNRRVLASGCGIAGTAAVALLGYSLAIRHIGPILAVDHDLQELRTSREEVRTKGSPKATFLLQNKGNAPLEITGIVSGCGCTTVSEERTTIPPGQSWPLVVEVRSLPAGTRSVAVEVQNNSNNSPLKRLGVRIDTAADAPFIVIGTTTVDFADARKVGITRQIRIVTVEEVGTQPWLTATRLQSLPFLTVRKTSFGESPYGGTYLERTYEFALTVASTVPEGQHHGILEVLCNDANRENSLASAINAYVRNDPPIRVTPTSVHIRKTADGQFAPARILVTTTQPSAELAIESVSCSVPWLNIVGESFDCPVTRRQVFRVDVDLETYSEGSSADITVRTSGPEPREYRVPVRISAEAGIVRPL